MSRKLLLEQENGGAALVYTKRRITCSVREQEAKPKPGETK
jgi:hypothetical protein